MVELKELLENTFPVETQNTKSSFRFFPICNEYDFYSILDDSALISAAKNPDCINVALLFGESHFLSLLPTLARMADVIILADIEVKLHAHNQHLLSTFTKAENISKFLEYYCADFPSTPFQHNDVPTKHTVYKQIDMLFGRQSPAFSSLKHHHFLHSIRQYQACKHALEQVSIVQIHLNLADSRACLTLSTMLQSYQAQFALCNFTNIHQYVETSSLRSSTINLLRYSQTAFIMYSTGPTHHLTAQCSQLEDYLIVLGRKQPIVHYSLPSHLPLFNTKHRTKTTAEPIVMHKTYIT